MENDTKPGEIWQDTRNGYIFKINSQRNAVIIMVNEMHNSSFGFKVGYIFSIKLINPALSHWVKL